MEGRMMEKREDYYLLYIYIYEMAYMCISCFVLSFCEYVRYCWNYCANYYQCLFYHYFSSLTIFFGIIELLDNYYNS